MSGIGNTIETDLVGETIELRRNIWATGSDSDKLLRGRCRAVTVGTNANSLWLWLEIVDEEQRELANAWGNYPYEIGDVVVVPTDDGGASILLRLIKT